MAKKLKDYIDEKKPKKAELPDNPPVMDDDPPLEQPKLKAKGFAKFLKDGKSCKPCEKE